MAGDQVKSTQSLLDLNFRSLAAEELSLKQMELNSATAKLDELRLELEKRRSSSSPRKGESAEVLTSLSSPTSMSPSLTRRSQPTQAQPSLAANSSLQSQRLWAPEPSLSAPKAPSLTINSTSTVPKLSLSSSPNFTRKSLSTENTDPFMTVPSRPTWGRPTSPRPQYYERPVSTSRLSSGSYDYAGGPRSSPQGPDGPPVGMYAEWAPPQRSPSPYDAQPRFSDDVSSLRRRPPQRSWNESDLDTVYEKKAPQERSDRASLGGVPVVKAWRESSLDSAPMKGTGDVSSTLPRGYKFSSMDRGPQGPERGPQGPDSVWRTGTGTLPRSFPPQQPISRIPVPPPGGRGQPHRPLPLSMIFRLQNAFWEHQIPPQAQFSPTPMTMASSSLVPMPVVIDLPSPAVVAPPANEEVPRPLSPTRLQPNLPPSLAEVQRVLEDIPRPLRRRGSQEHTMQAPLLPTDRRQYRQIMSRLFGRAASKPSPAPEQPKAEEKLQGSAGRSGPPVAEQVSEEENFFQMPPIPEELKTEEKLESATPKSIVGPEDPICIILEASQSAVGEAAPAQAEMELGVPEVIYGSQALELRSALKGRNSPNKSRPRRARLDPLILLLDGALTGELEVVSQALREVNDPSQPNEEGITALHNAICGANFHIVNLLISSGANVNAADSHGWTPLHCAASCNDLQICSVLVRHGAAIFATTYSDGTLAVERCDPYKEGYKECLTYLTEVEQCMGETQSGVVYALWDYTAEFSDELSLREGDSVTVLRKDGEGGNWWWAALCGREGYVPRNYFGMYPRVRPQRSPL
ncbi:relA-associated inhibitor isoform X2 [Pseudophryne corroboree]